MARNGKNIYRRKDGRCEGRVYYNGRKYKSVYGRTFKEVYEKMIKLRCEMNMPCKRDYYFNTLAGMWLEDRKCSVKSGTTVSYKTKLDKHILPYFKEVFASKLNNKSLSAFVASKRTESLSDKYISDMLIIIKSVMLWAEERYSMENNIKNYKNIRFKTKEPKLLTHAEQIQLNKHLKNSSDGISLSLLLEMYTGLRIGELCALQWKDIDLENRLITVNKSIQRLPDEVTGKSKVIITSTKTTTSDRLIPIPSFLMDRLKQAQKSGDCYLLSETPKIIEPRLLRNKFKAKLSEAGVVNIKFHSLRHGFATQCIQHSIDIKTISELLGHANTEITMKTYIHSSMQRKRECMEKLAWT
ncbi:MAG: site-specific integrase [Alphaproteobacteria bacterium]|nr:site-specific integrase [Alphaproteobacteria bacterium]